MNTVLKKQIATVFIRKKQVSWTAGLYFGMMVILILVKLFQAKSYFGILNDYYYLLNYSIISFLVCAFISYEFFYGIQKSNFEESLKTYYNGYVKIIEYQVFTLMKYILGLFLVMLLGVLCLCIKYSSWTNEWLIQIILNTFLSYCLIPFCGVLMGFAFSLVFPRMNGYLFMIAFVLLGSPLSNDMSAVLLENGVNICPIINLFQFFPSDLNWTPIYAFGNSVLPYRWTLTFFWGLLFTTLIFVKLNGYTKHSRIKQTLAASCMVCFLLLSLLPESKLLLSSSDPINSIMADWEYYFVKQTEDSLDDASFNVVEYDLKLNIRNMLFAEAKILVDNDSLNEYKFTLYHGYIVTSIANQNQKEVAFEQNGDYLSIESKEKSKYFVIRYKGYSSVYYSNIQGLFLPGYFPYYPQSGWNRVYNREYQGVDQSLLQKDTLFHVKVNSSRNVFCNLNSNGKNSFCGYTNGLTLMSGMYKHIDEGDQRIVYPYLDPSYNKATLQDFLKQNQSTKALPSSAKTIFITPSINNSSPYTFYCQFNDSITIQSIINFEQSYTDQAISSNKKALYTAYHMYLSNPQAIKDQSSKKMEEFKKAFPDQDYFKTVDPSATDLLLQFLDYYGEPKGLAMINDYLNNKTDNRFWKSFITIKQEGK